MDVVEWSRALDVRLSEWCCSVTMVWVQIRRGKNKNLTALKSNSNTVWFNFQNKNLTALKSNSNTVWFNFQTYILKIKPNSVRIRF